ncbi:MAG: hypothetical protein A2X59_08750 [Nitrospirae bacterium GWC2_42_7]|nr:MAG: hypothetical protein A2X59_08750 [Nitrospirae bacterium GWC2_42_7]
MSCSVSSIYNISNIQKRQGKSGDPLKNLTGNGNRQEETRHFKDIKPYCKEIPCHYFIKLLKSSV